MKALWLPFFAKMLKILTFYKNNVKFKRKMKLEVKEMYLDEKIELGILPADLKEIMKEADDYYSSGDDDYFYSKLDEVEAVAKQACLDKQISSEQLEAVFKRYGIR